MRKHLLILFLIVGSSLFTLCEGQYTVLHNFNGTDGQWPQGSLTFLDGKLYGMTNNGGGYASGNIFCINSNGASYKDLFDFNDTDGGLPNLDLTYSYGLFYGTTSTGGLLGEGCVFYIDTLGNNFYDMYDFYGNNGSTPTCDVIFSASQNIFYGMTDNGGEYNDGIIFSINWDGSGWKKRFDFNNGSGGAPFGSFLLSGGVLYGLTQAYGAYGNGTIFSIDTNIGSRVRVMHNFEGPEDAIPMGSLILSGHKLYGTTLGEYMGSYGSIFSINTDGSGYKVLLNFNDIDGANPVCTLTLSGGLLFGTATHGGKYGLGDIYCIDTNGTGFKDLFDFDGTNGAGPSGNLTLVGNTFYGMTNQGGSGSCYHGCGVIFSFKYTSLGLNNLPQSPSSINVYPNPSSGQFTIQSSVISGQSSVEVYDILGEKVCSQFNNQQTTFNIDLSNQPNGVYLYRVIESNGELIGEGKLIIQK